MTCDVRSTVRGKVPRVAFENIARSVLGPGYTLSLVLCGDTLARRLNTTYRKKTYKPNVLAFPLSRAEGEIILNVRRAEREARIASVSARERILFLFIHACLHLAGYVHGKKMEKMEQRQMKTLQLHK